AALDGPPPAAGLAGGAVCGESGSDLPGQRPSVPVRRDRGRGRGRPGPPGRDPARGGRVVNVFLWHVHGSWATAFVQGRHRYLVPVTPDRGPDGLGRAGSWEWPDSVVEVTREEAAGHPVDVVVLQRPSELERLAREWLGREPG